MTLPSSVLPVRPSHTEWHSPAVSYLYDRAILNDTPQQCLTCTTEPYWMTPPSSVLPVRPSHTEWHSPAVSYLYDRAILNDAPQQCLTCTTEPYWMTLPSSVLPVRPSHTEWRSPAVSCFQTHFASSLVQQHAAKHKDMYIRLVHNTCTEDWYINTKTCTEDWYTNTCTEDWYIQSTFLNIHT